jgi:competence protein ComEC
MVYVPLFGLIVVPVGLLAAFSGLFWPTLSGWVIGWNASVLEWALISVKALAKWPSAAVYTITPNLLEIGCYYILAAIIVWRLPSMLYWLRGYRLPAARHSRVATLTKAAAASALLLLALDSGYWYFQRHWRNDLRMTVLSVGDGSATIIELPKERVMLVDGGGFTDNAIFDVGQRIVAPALWRKKIGTIDVMVLSHPNSDHLNGLFFVAQHFKVRQLWTNGQAQGTDAYAQFRQIVDQRSIVAPEFETLARQHGFGKAQVQILWPPADLKQSSGAHTFDEPNNNSIVLRVVVGDAAIVLPGDIEGVAERALVARGGRVLKSDLLVAPHHGSRTSSTVQFLHAVQPETVIVSCAALGRYRFPHPTILARYRQNGITVFSTADNGAVTVIADGHDMVVLPTVAPSH